jgi:hypothetical protein
MMKHIWIALGSLVCLSALASAIAVRPAISQSPADATPVHKYTVRITSLVLQGHSSFSNGTAARTTVLISPITLSLPNNQPERFVGTVTSFDMAGQSFGDMASMNQVLTSSTEELEAHRALPKGENAPADRVVHWHVKPVAGKTWGEVAGNDDVTITFSETTD